MTAWLTELLWPFRQVTSLYRSVFAVLFAVLFSGQPNNNAFAQTSVSSCPAAMPLSSIGNGVAVNDNATGSGWILWTEQNVFSRFSPSPYPQNSDHLIAVQFKNGQWYFDNNNGLIPFVPANSDCLIAEVNFDSDTVTLLRDTDNVIQGINSGYDSGDLSIVANQWANQFNAGEFGVAGNGIYKTGGSASPTNPVSVNNSICPATISIGDLGNGIAASDNAVGEGWILWSAENVFTRFSPAPYPQNAKHLIAVKYSGGQWFVDNNSGLSAFTPAASDCLLASVNFSADSVTSLEGTKRVVEGIDAGYVSGNLSFVANKWANVDNAGEFGVIGTSVNQTSGSTTPVTPVIPITPTTTAACPASMPLGNVGNGIAASDQAVGNGWVLWSEQSVFSRFRPTPYPGNADHLIAVKYSDGQWFYDNNNGLIPFTPESNDCLIASVNFESDSVSMLVGTDVIVNGISSGYSAGDSEIIPNIWAGTANAGEFGVVGTQLSKTAVMSAPLSDAGTVHTVVLGETVTLDGSASTDGDGSIVSWVWNIVAGSTLGDAERLPWTPPGVGSFTLRLLVTDDDGLSSVSHVNVIVTAPPMTPVANAGTVHILHLGESVHLDGSASTGGDGSIVSWTWNIESGSFLGDSELLTWTPTSIGFYSVRLRITTDVGDTSISHVNVIVGAPPLDPIANAGTVHRVQIGDTVELDGSGSTDEDGSIVSWGWSIEAGMAIGSGEILNWTPPDAGVYTIRLVVTDDDGKFGISHVNVIVSNVESPNLAPFASAGADRTITLGDVVQLDASSSSDPDGSIVAWEWALIDGEVLGTQAAISWTPDSIGNFELTLLVTDDDGDTDIASVVVEVTEPQIPSIPQIDDYQLVFGDEFTGSVLDNSVWDTSLLWGPYLTINNEEQLYVDTLGMHSSFAHTPFTLTGDTLKITATKVTENLQPPVRPSANSPDWKPNSYSEYVQNRTVGSPGDANYSPGYDAEDVNYLSGIITSYGTFSMTHGYVEMRAKLPAGAGLWPAFWMLPQHWVEDVPEIDVMEFLGQDVDRLYNTYHYFDVENNWAQISTPSMQVFSDDWTQQFHTFGVAWSPTEIVWYVNGEETHRVSDANYDIANQPMHLIANLAVGGNWPGAPDANTAFPAEFEIDYIRAYKKKLNPVLDLANDYQLMFNDEFAGTTLDASKWNTHFLWGPYLPINNEDQYYVDALGSDAGGESPFSLANGVLSITARAADDPAGFTIPEALPASNDSIWTAFPNFQQNLGYSAPDYTSGIITSYDSFKFAHGYAEIRAKIPAGDGLWPAFWLLNGYYVGQQPEIDIMEVRGENPSEIVHSYHYQNPALVSQSFTTQHPDAQSDYSEDFHTYGVRWQPGKITWYIDGVVVHTLVSDTVAYQVMYVIANLAVGGDFNYVATDTSLFPSSFDIDYIRVYQEVGN